MIYPVRTDNPGVDFGLAQVGGKKEPLYQSCGDSLTPRTTRR